MVLKMLQLQLTHPQVLINHWGFTVGLSSARLIEEQLTSKWDMWPCFRMRGHLDPGRVGRKALKTCHVSKPQIAPQVHIFPHLNMLSCCQQLRHCRAATGLSRWEATCGSPDSWMVLVSFSKEPLGPVTDYSPVKERCLSRRQLPNCKPSLCVLWNILSTYCFQRSLPSEEVSVISFGERISLYPTVPFFDWWS